MSPVLPGGRGRRISPDAIAGQEESYAQRQTLISQQSFLYYHSLGSLFQPTTVLAAPPVRFTLFPMPELKNPLQATHVVVPMGTGAISPQVGVVKGALYSYDVTRTPDSFVQLPQTEFEATLGQTAALYEFVSTRLPGAPLLGADQNFQNLFFGFRTSLAVSVNLLMQEVLYPATQSYFKLNSFTDFNLPKVISRDSLTVAGTGSQFIPAVTFLSSYGARLWGIT